MSPSIPSGPPFRRGRPPQPDDGPATVDHGEPCSGAIGAPMLAALALLSAIAPLATDMYLPGLPRVGVDLGASASTVQLTLMTFMLGLAAGQLAIGPLSDGLGRRRPMLVGAALLSAAGLACALAPSIGVLIAARFLQGFTGGIGVVLARAVIADRTAGDRAARLFSLMMIITGVAPVVAPLMGGVLVGPIGWRGVFYVLAGLALLMLVAAWRFVPESLPAARRRPVDPRAFAGAMGAVLRRTRYLGYTATFALGFGALFGYISASPFIMQDIMGFTPGVFSLLFALNAVGLTGANAVNSRLIGRFRPRTLLTVGVAALVTVAAAMLAVVLSGTGARWPLLVLMFLLTTSIGLIFGNATALALDEVRSRAGTGSAVLGAAQFAVGAAVAPLVGLGGGTSAVPMAVTVSVCTVGAALALGTTSRRRAGRR